MARLEQYIEAAHIQVVDIQAVRLSPGWLVAAVLAEEVSGIGIDGLTVAQKAEEQRYLLRLIGVMCQTCAYHTNDPGQVAYPAGNEKGVPRCLGIGMRHPVHLPGDDDAMGHTQTQISPTGAVQAVTHYNRELPNIAFPPGTDIAKAMELPPCHAKPVTPLTAQGRIILPPKVK